MCYKGRVIIGLTGRNAAGKGEVAKFLQSKGFCFHSLSDVLRSEIAGQGLTVTRQRLIETGKNLRVQEGPGVLARRILEKIGPEENHVVDSFRHSSEVEVFKARGDFRLVAIIADISIRFERGRNRAREGDPASLEEFQKLEEMELAGSSQGGQQLLACESLADFRIANNNSLEKLHQKLIALPRRVMSSIARPNWDEYFMRMATVAALRSNCVKRKVAAIIVRDRRVISTGYNGTPRGTKNCYEGGCQRCSDLVDSGTKLEECLCSHGEENAITQAAYHGVSVKKGTLYTTCAPCLMCTKMIINAGICEVVYNLEYALNATSLTLLKEAGVVCRRHCLN